MAVGIIVKNYDHFNRALGKHITSKAHYEKEMKAGGFVSFDEAERNAADYRRRNPSKKYEISEKALGIINSLKNSADSKGRLKLSDRQIDAMRSTGAIKKIPSYMKLPSSYEAKGGFK